MVFFNYSNGRPDNHEHLEEMIKNKYKKLFDKFPNSKTTFTWTGERWTISSDIEMAYFTIRESDDESE